MPIEQYLADKTFVTAVTKMQRRDNLRDCSKMEREIRRNLLTLITPDINGTPLEKCNAREICTALIKLYQDAFKRTKQDGLYAKARNTCPQILNKIEELEDLSPFEIKAVLPKAQEIIEQIQEKYKTAHKS